MYIHICTFIDTFLRITLTNGIFVSDLEAPWSASVA